jgi:hypothetical protein
MLQMTAGVKDASATGEEGSLSQMVWPSRHLLRHILKVR